MKNIQFSVLWTLLVVFSCDVKAKVLTMAESINVAGQQRMLSQRISKNYLTVTNRIFKADSKKELADSIARFEQNMGDLNESISGTEARTQYDKLKVTWIDFNKIASSTPSHKNVERILVANNELLNLAHQLVLSLESFAEKAGARLVNISGRQRMLSQRIAFYYFASQAGYNDEVHHQQLALSVMEFSQAMNILLEEKRNTPEIKTSLEKVEKKWSYHKAKFENVGATKYMPRTVKIVTEIILDEMRRITGLYEEIYPS